LLTPPLPRAKAFHKKGLRVFATARNIAKVQELKALGIEVIQLDVVDDKSINLVVEKVGAVTGGKLDFLVNNSGGGISFQSIMLPGTLTD
jgi:1-acylglycerone phosphate reductase